MAEPMIPDDLCPDSYLVLGVAQCFYKADGEIHSLKLIEPIPSAALETLMQGIPTSYEVAGAFRLGAVLGDRATIPPLLAGYTDQLCADFPERAIATARTYQAHPHAQTFIPLDSLYTGFNFSTEKKRILNAKRTVRDDDNIKQHIYTHKVL